MGRGFSAVQNHANLLVAEITAKPRLYDRKGRTSIAPNTKKKKNQAHAASYTHEEYLRVLLISIEGTSGSKLSTY
jgi:hypothetical protein